MSRVAAREGARTSHRHPLLAFVAESEAARGTSFTREERQAARAALVYATAYAARCEHSDAVVMPWGQTQGAEDEARSFLRRHATELLRPTRRPT